MQVSNERVALRDGGTKKKLNESLEKALQPATESSKKEGFLLILTI